jgi:hypothetical protein
VNLNYEETQLDELDEPWDLILPQFAKLLNATPNLELLMLFHDVFVGTGAFHLPTLFPLLKSLLVGKSIAKASWTRWLGISFAEAQT